MSPNELGPLDALIIVDVQNDFCPRGALPVQRGHEVVPVLNDWIDAARRGRAVIAASRDWHPANHVSFRERGGPWPPHCVQATRGAELRADLQLPADAWVISKGTEPDRDAYSAFDRTDLAERLKTAGVHRVWIGGLALDVCVRATALDAIKAGFETHVIADATRAVNVRPDDGARALTEMESAGAVIVRNPNHA